MKHLLPLFLFFLPGIFPLAAQDNYVIGDLFNNQTFEYQKENEALKNSKLNFYEEIDIDYPVFTGLRDSLVQKKLNRRFRQIALEQIATDSFRVKLFLHLKQSLGTYFTIFNKVKDQLGIYQDNEFKFTPDIKSSEFEFLSCFKSVASFMVTFTYSTQYQKYTLEEDLHYSQVYYFNLVTGKEYHPADVFKKASEKEVAAMVEKAVQKNVEHIVIPLDQQDSDYYTDGEEDGEYEGDDMKPSAPREKKLVDFSLLRDGFPYLKAFSIAYYIPQWASCTKNIYGLDQELRLTFDEIRKHLNPKGPYASLITYQPDSIRMKDQNNPLYCEPNYVVAPRYAYYDKTPYVAQGKVKIVTMRTLSKTKDGKGGIAEIHALTRQIEYNQIGYIREIRNYSSETRVYNTQLFTFDKNRRLVKKSIMTDGKVTEAEDYAYDKNGNMTTRIKTDESGVPESTFYYYSGNFFLEEHYGCYGFGGSIERNYRKSLVNNRGLITGMIYSNSYFSETEYKYDKNDHLLMSYLKGGNPAAGQSYVYDRNGNMLTYEYDNGRYLTEYRYDERNNLIRETKYNNKNVSSVAKAEYNVENQLIKLELSNPGNTTNIFTFSYEYW